MMLTNTIVKYVILTTVMVAVRKFANIGWRLDVAPGKTARPSGWKWLRPKCSCGRAQVTQLLIIPGQARVTWRAGRTHELAHACGVGTCVGGLCTYECLCVHGMCMSNVYVHVFCTCACMCACTGTCMCNGTWSARVRMHVSFLGV
jgi:hypothetical protein